MVPWIKHWAGVESPESSGKISGRANVVVTPHPLVRVYLEQGYEIRLVPQALQMQSSATCQLRVY